MADFSEDVINERIKLFQNEMCNAKTAEDFIKLESEFEDLQRLIADVGEEATFSFRIRTLARKLGDLKKEKEHETKINKMGKKIRELEDKVTRINIPVFKHPTETFDRLRMDVAVLETYIKYHKDECYAICSLKQAVIDIKEKIEYLDSDNKAAIGWLTAKSVLTGASIGVAFIPLVGFPISAALIAVSIFGKLGHRLAVSHERKKRFTKKNMYELQLLPHSSFIL